VFSGVSKVKEVDGVGDKGSGHTIIFDIQTLSGAIMNMSLRSAHFVDEVSFLGKKAKLWSWHYSVVLDNQKFQIMGCQIIGILLYFDFVILILHIATLLFHEIKSAEASFFLNLG